MYRRNVGGGVWAFGGGSWFRVWESTASVLRASGLGHTVYHSKRKFSVESIEFFSDYGRHAATPYLNP